jgi:hypothetical protein
MIKTRLDTDIYSEILRAVHPSVVSNARKYRQQYGVFTLSVITVMEMVSCLDPQIVPAPRIREQQRPGPNPPALPAIG